LERKAKNENEESGDGWVNLILESWNYWREKGSE